MSSYLWKGRPAFAVERSQPSRPAITREDLIGNAAIQEQLAQRDADQQEHRGILGALGGAIGHGQPGQHDDAKKDPKAATVTGSRYGDTFEGGRWNRRGGAGNAGLGRLVGGPGFGFAGNGKGKASEGGDEGPAPTAYPGTTTTSSQGSDGPKATQGDEAGGGKDVAPGMATGPSNAASQPLTDVYGQPILDIESIKKNLGTKSTPREDDTGGAQHGPTPLDRGRGPGRAAGLPPWLAGGPGEGRGGTGQGAGGASDQDWKNIAMRSGGATDAEKKEVGTPLLALEQAMKANQWTDPTRGRGT